MEAFSKIITITFVVIALFVVPVLGYAGQHDQITQESITNTTVEFVSSVLNSGKLTQGMYNAFIHELNATNEIYDVSMTYSKSTIVPGKIGQSETTTENFYTNEIKRGLFSGDEDGAVIDGLADGEIHFNKGSYFTVSVKNRSKTNSSILLEAVNKIHPSSSDVKATYGGMIRDEVWE